MDDKDVYGFEPELKSSSIMSSKESYKYDSEFGIDNRVTSTSSINSKSSTGSKSRKKITFSNEISKLPKIKVALPDILISSDFEPIPESKVQILSPNTSSKPTPEKKVSRVGKAISSTIKANAFIKTIQNNLREKRESVPKTKVELIDDCMKMMNFPRNISLDKDHRIIESYGKEYSDTKALLLNLSFNQVENIQNFLTVIEQPGYKFFDPTLQKLMQKSIIESKGNAFEATYKFGTALPGKLEDEMIDQTSKIDRKLKTIEGSNFFKRSMEASNAESVVSHKTPSTPTITTSRRKNLPPL
jgi:hypothetical protein